MIRGRIRGKCPVKITGHCGLQQAWWITLVWRSLLKMAAALNSHQQRVSRQPLKVRSVLRTGLPLDDNTEREADTFNSIIPSKDDTWSHFMSSSLWLCILHLSVSTFFSRKHISPKKCSLYFFLIETYFLVAEMFSSHLFLCIGIKGREAKWSSYNVIKSMLFVCSDHRFYMSNNYGSLLIWPLVQRKRN